jgi:thiamine pyrophosphokinase
VDLDRPPDIVVIAGGERVSPALVAAVPAGARVVAADAGVDAAAALGWSVDIAVGDFDSISAPARRGLERSGVDVRPFPTDKDATDLELALEAVGELADGEPCRVLVLGLEGGRPDHALANLLVAAAPRFAGLDVELVLAEGRAWVVRDRLLGGLGAGALVSIVPVHGAATVSVTGVRWPLDRSHLAAGTTRGVSNRALGGPVELTVHEGVALCIAPRTQESS